MIVKKSKEYALAFSPDRRGNQASFVMFATVILAFGALISTQAFAQAADRTLSGTITALSGSPIPNAKVAIKNTASGEMESVAANENGSYVVPHLPPGTYETTALAPGYAEARMAVTINAGSDQVTNIVRQASAKRAVGTPLILRSGGKCVVSRVGEEYDARAKGRNRKV